MSKILIKNGTVIDGSRSARFQADVLVEGERIVKIVYIGVTRSLI